MNKLFGEFKKSTLNDWKEQFLEDLKGKEHNVLEFTNEIEEIDFKAYYHNSEISTKTQQPGNFPYTRGENKLDNSWATAQIIEVGDEEIANNHALKLLMEGVDSLYFRSIKKNIHWAQVLTDIEIAYISVCFEIDSFEDYAIISSLGPVFTSRNVSFAYDGIAGRSNAEFSELAKALKINQQALFLINGYGVQQSGASIAQEIGFCLNGGHEILLGLMNEGLDIDEAAACIHFNIGIGPNYFNEISKVRAIRTLWSKIISAYNPQHSCSHTCTITATIGFTNKSLKDPYTNLLRQTTEAMSAISGGVNKLIVQPYDANSLNGSSELSQRMAINISLILKEESYFDKVIDPTGGSYSVEHLTELFSEKGWLIFQELEKKGGILTNEGMSYLKDIIQSKRAQRIRFFESSKQTLIGINKYFNIEEVDNAWEIDDPYLGIPSMVFEKLEKTHAHEKN